MIKLANKLNIASHRHIKNLTAKGIFEKSVYP